VRDWVIVTLDCDNEAGGRGNSVAMTGHVRSYGWIGAPSIANTINIRISLDLISISFKLV
jgi:hypothetical protein